jgi:transforming growth factor-beta-induced protein
MPEPTTMPEPTAMPEPALKDIVGTAVGDGRFTTLVAAIQAADLVDTLKGKGPFTVFAPTDEAFAKLPAGTLDELLKPENKQQLTDILLYHVTPGKVMAADVKSLSSVATVLGKDVAIKVDMGNVYINDAKVIITDIEASNGVIHVIDSVILPPTEEANTIVDIAAADGRFKTLVAAVQAAGLTETLSGEGPFTVFAPTDEAFAKLPAGTLDELLKPESKQALTDILLYHVAPGKVMASDVTSLTSAATVLGKDIAIKAENGNVFVNEAQVILTDIEASNGVIHVIDTVILPPADETMSKNIAEIAASDGRFKTLVAALQAAGLVETLSGEGPFTVFAPTDDAFAKLSAGTVENLLKPENKQQLTDILLYHVVPGKVLAESVLTMDGKSAETALKGQSIKISIKDGKVFLNDNIQVIITDIEASNGVIHVIDAVLLPK